MTGSVIGVGTILIVVYVVVDFVEPGEHETPDSSVSVVVDVSDGMTVPTVGQVVLLLKNGLSVDSKILQDGNFDEEVCRTMFVVCNQAFDVNKCHCCTE